MTAYAEAFQWGRKSLQALGILMSSVLWPLGKPDVRYSFLSLMSICETKSYAVVLGKWALWLKHQVNKGQNVCMPVCRNKGSSIGELILFTLRLSSLFPLYIWLELNRLWRTSWILHTICATTDFHFKILVICLIDTKSKYVL